MPASDFGNALTQIGVDRVSHSEISLNFIHVSETSIIEAGVIALLGHPS
jgi:hypothetical protein